VIQQIAETAKIYRLNHQVGDAINTVCNSRERKAMPGIRCRMNMTGFLSLFAIFIGTAAFADEADLEAKVVEVIDAATIIVSYNGHPSSCLYIGVSAPESENPLSSISLEARKFNKDLVEGKSVRLEFDEQKYDKYGRLLAYVHCDDVFVNAEVIRQGYGSVMIISPNTKHDEYFLKLEREAREAKRGLWAGAVAVKAPAQDSVSLEEQIAIIARKIDELSSKIDRLIEIIKLQLGISPTAEQEKTEEKAESIEVQNDQMVYITASGKKYHKPGCRYLTGDYSSVTVEEAKRKGLEPCSLCYPK
jgi:micrococcal nuclease